MSTPLKMPDHRVMLGILPSLITLGNLVAGFAAIGVTAHAQFIAKTSDSRIMDERGLQFFAYAGLLILIGMICDAFDGKIARMTNQTSDFGEQLDSLCDVVTFGVAPAYIVFLEVTSRSLFARWHYAWACAMLFVICAALRLARFNVETTPDEESHRYFRGLPTPAAAGVIASLAIFEWRTPYEALWAARIMPFAAIILAGLMVSRIRYVHVLNMLMKDRKPFVFLAVLIFSFFILFAWAHQLEYILLSGFIGYMLSGPIAMPYLIYKQRKIAAARAESKALEEEEDSLF